MRWFDLEIIMDEIKTLQEEATAWAKEHGPKCEAILKSKGLWK